MCGSSLFLRIPWISLFQATAVTNIDWQISTICQSYCASIDTKSCRGSFPAERNSQIHISHFKLYSYCNHWATFQDSPFLRDWFKKTRSSNEKFNTKFERWNIFMLMLHKNHGPFRNFCFSKNCREDRATAIWCKCLIPWNFFEDTFLRTAPLPRLLLNASISLNFLEQKQVNHFSLEEKVIWRHICKIIRGDSS